MHPSRSLRPRWASLARREGLPQLGLALLARSHHVAHALLLHHPSLDLAAAVRQAFGHVGDLSLARVEEWGLAGRPKHLVALDEPVFELLLRLLRRVGGTNARRRTVDQEFVPADLHLGLRRPERCAPEVGERLTGLLVAAAVAAPQLA